MKSQNFMTDGVREVGEGEEELKRPETTDCRRRRGENQGEDQFIIGPAIENHSCITNAIPFHMFWKFNISSSKEILQISLL